MTIVEERLPALEQLWLDSGGHESFETGACIMEAVAWVAGEPFSDHPMCASPVLGAFLRSWNDALLDDERQMLKPYITRLVGTATGKADDEKRAWLAVDWLVHEYTPAVLRLAGLTSEAETLEQLVSLTSTDVYLEVRTALVSTRQAARKRRDEAAWAAEAAGAAGAAGAAWAAWAAAKKAQDEGGDYSVQRQAAKEAALPIIREAFAPTLKGLQASALVLLDRMIEVGREREAAWLLPRRKVGRR